MRSITIESPYMSGRREWTIAVAAYDPLRTDRPLKDHGVCPRCGARDVDLSDETCEGGCPGIDFDDGAATEFHHPPAGVGEVGFDRPEDWSPVGDDDREYDR
jgi:hypothetical protein